MFDGCLYFNTASLARLLEREWARAFAAFELTPPQGFLLRMVLERPGLVQRELATALTIARPTATRLLDGLEARKLIVRRAGPNDGREQRIHPTAAAEAIRVELNAASATVTRRLKHELGSELFDQTVAKLRSIRQAIG